MRVALFIASGQVPTEIPAIAADCGFRSIVSQWRGSDETSSGITIRDAMEVSASGTTRVLPAAVVVDPVLISVLTTARGAWNRARHLAESCDAYWGHYTAALQPRRGISGDATIASATVEFQPGRIPLRIVLGSDLPHAIAANLIHSADPLSQRIIAPLLLISQPDTGYAIVDPVANHAAVAGSFPHWRDTIRSWLRYVHDRRTAPAALELPGANDLEQIPPPAIGADCFVRLFRTSPFIATKASSEAQFAYLDPLLERADGRKGEESLHETLSRRRVNTTVCEDASLCLVEPGVGRACLIDGLRLHDAEGFHDYTILGVGLTPFSEGGYVNIGRKIDGKASLTRAWHRKNIAERLEGTECRTGRVVAILRLPGDPIEMPDGSYSPSALVVRAFRCAYRVKQLDPLICCLHSIQHTPLVFAFLLERVRELRRLSGANHDRGLASDEALAQALESQSPSQESLREILNNATAKNRSNRWARMVREARLDALDSYAPILISVAKRRVAQELNTTSFDDIDYVHWFAESVGAQLAIWRQLRFLHDYHHPGVSRWTPHHLYTLGENNVTLLAEFPDLDTGIFVEDAEAALMEELQLATDDVTVLRREYSAFHGRDVQAAETIVRTLTAILFRDDPDVMDGAVDRFRKSYARNSR